MAKELRTIVLAAGKGTRMKSETPKVLHRIWGRALIDYVLDAVKAAGSKKTVLVVGHGSEDVAAHVGPKCATALQKNLAGTADAVQCAAAEMTSYRGDVLVVCGDTPLLRPETIRAVVRRHRKSEAHCTFLTAVLHDNFGYGRIIRTMSGKAVAIREEKDASELEKHIREINVGVYCFRAPDLFAGLSKIEMNAKKKEFYLTDIIGVFAEQGLKIETVETEEPGEGLGVNTRVDLAAAGDVIRRRILTKWMLEGVTIEDPASTYIYPDVKIGRDSVIHPQCVIENTVRIGRNCEIGPFCHLRPGAKLADEVQIGNFAEVSRTQIGSGSIAKHFSFLGDAYLGKNVNIGAGTVTANYDGKNKSKTYIRDGAFIGSDSVLIAPLTVGAGALTAAGSVVKKNTNIPKEAVVAGIPARVLREKKSA